MSAQAGAAPARPASSALRKVAQAGEDCLVVTGRNLRHFVRQPQLLIF